MGFPDFLRIAVLPLRHLTELNTTHEEDQKFSGGVEARFIDVLSNSLRFEYQLLVPEDGEWGRQEDDGSWTGMLGLVHRDEADVAIGHLTITQSRLADVDFLPYTVEENTFATNLPGFLPRGSFYLAPFTLSVWLTSLALLSVMPVIFRLLMNKKVSMQTMYFSMFGVILYQPVTFSISDIKDRILFFAWFTFALILSSSYRTVLLSSMTVPMQDHGVRTINELASAIIAGQYRATTSSGSVDKELLKTSEYAALRVIGEHIVEEEWLSDNIVEAPKNFKKFTAVLGPRFFFQLEYGEAPFTTKWLFKETVNFWIVGLAIRRNFCCKKQLANHIGRIVSTGIYHKLYQDELFKAQLNFKSKDLWLPGNRGLSLSDLSGAFILWTVGIFISSIVFWFENRKNVVSCVLCKTTPRNTNKRIFKIYRWILKSK